MTRSPSHASPEVARANAALTVAQAAAWEALDPDELRIAMDMVAAVVEQKRAAVAMCPKPTVLLKPEPIVDPWESTAANPAELAWWCEVFGACE